ncbi:hypothetical protein DPSP01_000066 [Paraphaeosphaeria sporulosa]|uniref:F-box domain-containing protein n=1 Tax=Paraphaeosphaeria sporulosa TaxID=1460663 RepID=A0A177CZU6_9PLEO|nr:uncharacterized protein CC84DRAFT_1080222 [Paraphaeosphaeria sporulosa]OAG13014.1 hypothetical protein CC84DRAFT_1080222 [Paraphaeosphaeria sporulosa]
MGATSKLILFPAELILEIIERLPFGDGSTVSNLARTHSRLQTILSSYEQSLAYSFARKELRHAPVDFPTKQQGFRWMQSCVKRYDCVDDLMAMLVSEHNVFPVRKHNMGLVNTGLLLLYHLQSFESHPAKLAFLKTLPKDPLTAMYLAVHHATLTARYHGEGIIHQRTYGRFMDANTIALRSDIEFCFAEASLQLGPAFIQSSLLPTDPPATSLSAEVTLLNFYHDHAIHDWFLESVLEGMEGIGMLPITQGPRKGTKEKSLWTTLLERVAGLMECPLENVRGAVEEDAAPHNHGLAWLDLEGKAALMKGEDVVPRLVEA